MSPLGRFQMAWCAQGFLREVVLIYPVYAIMIGEQGVSPLQLSTLFVVWSATVVVFEVPSGALADRWSRKSLMVASGLIKALAFPVWYVFPEYWGYMAGFVIWGFGSTIASGTGEALVHDTLRDMGETERFAKVYGRGRAAQSLGVATALFFGGMLADVGGYALPLALSALGPLLAAAAVQFFIREPRRIDVAVSGSYLATLSAGLREARGSKKITTLVVMLSTIVVVYGTIDEYLGPFLKESGELQLRDIGFIYAMLLAAQTVSASLAHRLPVQSSRGAALIVGGATCLLIVAAGLEGYVAGVLLALYFAGSSAGEVLLHSGLQRAIEGRARATITSLAGMGRELMGMVCLLALGLQAELHGWSASFQLVGTVTLLLCGFFALRAPVLER